MKDIFECIGCSLYDPDYGCLKEHAWECPQEPFDFEEGGDQDA